MHLAVPRAQSLHLRRMAHPRTVKIWLQMGMGFENIAAERGEGGWLGEKLIPNEWAHGTSRHCLGEQPAEDADGLRGWMERTN